MRRLILLAFALGSMLLFGKLPALCAQVDEGDKSAPAAENRSIDDLIKDLSDGSYDRKMEALLALQKLGPKAKAAVPELVAAIHSKELRVREEAVEALGKIGPDAKEALPKLRLVLAGEEEEPRMDEFFIERLIHSIVEISPAIDQEITRALPSL